jgi:iron(III) transport system substrate-binding protein
MKSRKRTTRFVSTSFLIALSLVAAACGSDDDKAASTTAAAATTAAPTTAAPTTAAATSAPEATTADTESASTESTATDDTATDDTATATTEASTDTTEAATESNAKAATPAEWDAIVAKAKEEGSVTIYSSQGLDQLNDLAKRFEDKYGIHVEVVRAIDSDQLAKVQAEHDTGTGIADVLAQATAAWSVEKSAAGGWFAPFVGPAMDEAGYTKALNVSPNGDYFVSSAAVLTFGWNTELWPDGLKDYTDLLDPGLADGKIGVIEPAAGSIVDFYLYLEEKYGEDFITKLAAQKPRIYPSSLPMAQALTSGEISAASFVQVLTDEKANGAPVDSGLSDTVWGALFQTSVLQTAPHPNAAQVLANFMITPKGQEAIARKAGAALPNIEGAITLTDKVRRQDLEKLTPEFVAEYQQKWDALFTG